MPVGGVLRSPHVDHAFKKLSELSTDNFIENFRQGLAEFDSAILPQEPLSKENWRKLMNRGICLPAIPRQYGGRESHHEMCEIIEVLSAYNLPLGMYTMIVTVLFLRNVARSGDAELQKEVFDDFLQNPVIGGLAFTEPSGGSNLSRMQTVYYDEGEVYRIVGKKHWQAFSAQADWWIICAKHPDVKRFAYFVHRRSEGGFVTAQVYKSLGLNNLGYGLNEIDVLVPRHRKLNKVREGLGDAAEILCASRFSKAAMSSGFLRRLTLEATRQAQNRKIGSGSLLDIEYVRYKINRIKLNYIACNALYRHLLLDETYSADMEDSMFASLATKVLASELMLESAIDYQQLCGGEGYRFECPDNIAAYALLDSRVYTIFDGTNDLLCQHLANLFKREVAASQYSSSLEFIQSFQYTAHSFEHLTDVNLPHLESLDTQSKTVILGRILSRIYGISALQKLAGRMKIQSEAGVFTVQFSNTEIAKTVLVLKNDICGLINEFDLSGLLRGGH